MITTLADQYLAQNAGRRYPFRDDTELPDWLPDSGVLDFRCTLYGVQAGTAPEARLVNVAHTGDGNVRFTVDLSAGGVAADTIRFLVPSDISGAPYTAYASGNRSTGSLTVTAAAIPPPIKTGPYDAEVEWLANSAGATINTGIRCSLVRSIHARYMVQSWAAYGQVFNCYVNEQYNATRIITQGSNNGYGWASLNTRAGGSLQIPLQLNKWYDFNAVVDNGVFAADINGQRYEQAVVTGSENANSVTLFGSIVSRVSCFTIYGVDKTVLLDLSPVSKDGVGYMYDSVSGELLGSGQPGSLVTGPEMPAGEYPVDIPLAWSTVVCDSLKVDSVQSAQGADDARDDDDPAARTVTTVVSGDIEIAEGRNTEPYLDGNSLRLDIFKGGGLGERCQSAVMGGQRCDTVLFTINGERPGSDGDLRIVGESGVTVKPIPEEHAIGITMDDATAGLMSEGCAPECSEA